MEELQEHQRIDTRRHRYMVNDKNIDAQLMMKMNIMNHLMYV